MRLTSRSPGLDLLRAVAIGWVMLFHSFLVGGLGPHFEWLSRFGWAGVDIFFVLNGFLIGSQVLTNMQRGAFSFGGFYARRAWRIVPAFVVVLALYTSMPALREEPGLAPWWQFATFTMNLLIDYDRHPAFSHAWSLCVEEHFYFAFPLLAWWLGRRANAKALIAIFVSVVVLGIALRAAVWLHDAALAPPRNWFVEDLYYPTWMRLDGLLVGIGLAVLRIHRPQTWGWLQSHADACLLCGLFVCAAALVLFRDRTGFAANTIGWPLLSLGFGLFVLAGADHRSRISRWGSSVTAWIATISYSLYLSHKMAYHIVEVWLAPLLPNGGVPLFAVYAAVALVFGATLHFIVERPFLTWRDRNALKNGEAGARTATPTANASAMGWSARKSL